MHREIWVTALACFLSFIPNSYSQDKSIFNQAYIDPFIINPACTGSERIPVARISVDRQWIGFKDAPSTILLTGNTRMGSYDFYTPKGLINKSPLKIGDRVGFGGALYYDNNGPLNSIGGLLSYGYHIPVNRNSQLSMGLTVYMLNRSVNVAWLEPDQPADDYLLQDQNSVFRINYGIGLYYYTDEFFTGLSINELFPMETNNSFKQTKMPGFFLLAGYRFNKISRVVDFEPSVIVNKQPEENLNFDFFVRLYYLKFHWASLSYSTSGHADIMLAVRLYRAFYLGYNYKYNVGKIASYSNGSHSISLGINLGLRGMSKWEYYN